MQTFESYAAPAVSFIQHHKTFGILFIASCLIVAAIRVVIDVAGDEIAGIRTSLLSAIPALRDFLLVIGSVFFGVWCWLQTARFKLMTWSKNKAYSSVAGFVFIASVYFLIEILLAIIKFLIDPANAKKFFKIPDFHTPLWLDIVLLCLAAIIVWHNWGEWKLRIVRYEIFADMRDLLLDLDRDRQPGLNSCTPQKRMEFLDSLLTITRERLGHSSKRNIQFSLMEPEGQELSGDLVTTYTHPQDGFMQGDLVLKQTEGAAGRSFSDLKAIYVPSTKHRMAIDVDSNKTIGSVYKPDATVVPIKCLLCVPILKRGRVVGVLNVVCNRRSAFDIFHVNVARLTAAIISMID